MVVTKDGHGFRIPSMPHSLDVGDLVGWGCKEVANLLLELPFEEIACLTWTAARGQARGGRLLPRIM